MARIVGLGGVFFRSADPAALAAWYGEHLGLEVDASFGGAMFNEDAARPGYTLWSPFAQDTAYFGRDTQGFMINFRVDDLDPLLAHLRDIGTVVDEKVDDSEYGRFGWFTDPDGNRVELWQPPSP